MTRDTHDEDSQGRPSTAAESGTGGAKDDRLRQKIDSGKTGDKVAASDPAAAPLGTDSEAGAAEPMPRDRGAT